MSPTRRVIIILISVLTGTVLSYFLYMSRRGANGLSKEDYHMLLTNMIFSLGLILGIGFMFIWRKKKDL